MTILNNTNFDTEIAQGTVVVDFYADWCGPCKMLAPIIEELGNDFAGRAKVFKLNTDESSAIAQKYGVISIPTVMIFKDGEVKEQVIGFQPKPALATVIERNL